MHSVFEFDLNNQQEIFEIGKVAKQSNGAVLYKVNDTVILSTVTVDYDNPVEEDFTPLTVQYIEKSYAAGKIPGGFVKREQKPGDFETLTSRVIDRSLRPLFPKGFRYPVQLTTLVLSVDAITDLQVASLNASSAALYLSDLPIKSSVCGVRVAKINNKFIVNPNFDELDNSTLDLYLAGTKKDLLMIEMRSISSLEQLPTVIEPIITTDIVATHSMNDMNEDELLEAISIGIDAIDEATTAYSEAFDTASLETKDIELIKSSFDENLKVEIASKYSTNIKEAVTRLAKSERDTHIKAVVKEVIASGEYGEDFELIYNIVSSIKRDIVRDMILNDKIRADGRGLKDVRPISIETNILPSAHSSCLFTRGQTQALVVATLGGDRDGQMYDILGSTKSFTENFMLHYNFPSFSVGEAKPIFAPGRRELGHGNLGKRALESSIDSSYDKTIRVVSEILESNGSSSMATVCGASLALKAADVPISSLVSGVAMGMVIEGDKYSILTDIMGLEDHDGDMDFKVAGTKDGITALQMDIKLGGISLEVLKEALYQAKEARSHILDIMEEASEEIVSSKALPISKEFFVDPSQIIDIIGQAGKVVRGIIDEFGVSVDLDKKSGSVKVSGTGSSVEKACSHIKTITSSSESVAKIIDFTKLYKEDELVKGVVKRVVDFGAFLELPKGGEGLLHISKISKSRIDRVSDVLSAEDSIDVKVLKVSKDRIELSAII